VTGAPKSGSSGRYSRTGSSSESLPSSARRTIAAAVNCLETEPASKIVSGVMAAGCSRCAMPNPRAYTVSPARVTETAQPAVVSRSQSLNTASTWAAVSGVSPTS